MSEEHGTILSKVPALPMASAGSRAWLVLGLLLPVYVCSMFYRMAPTVLALDLAREFSVGTGDLALLSGATMLGYGLMQLPSGLLADSLGGRKTLCLFTGVVGVSTLAFGLASSFQSVVVARLFTGMGLACTVPCLAVLARVFPPGLYGRVSSVLLASGTVGTLLASAPLAGMSELVGWRPVMLMGGSLSLGLTMAMWFLLHDGPAGEAKKPEPQMGLGQGLGLVLGTPAFWPLCLGFTCLLSVYFSFAGLWWGPYLMEGCQLSKTQTGMVLFVAIVASIPVMPLLAMLSDRLQSRRKVLIPCAALALTSMSMLALFPGNLSLPWLMLQALTFTVACGLAAVAFAAVRELFPLTVVGTATGCLNTLAPLGAAIIQKVFGVVLAWRLASDAALPTAYGETICVNLVFLGMALLAFTLTRESYPHVES